MKKTLMLIAALGLVAGCGKKDAISTAEAGTVVSDVNVAAPPAAAAAATQVNCATAPGQSAPAGSSPDDILGVRQGMSLADVRAVLTCRNPNYQIREKTNEVMFQSGEFRHVRSASITSLVADTGLDKVGVDFAGAPNGLSATEISRVVEYVEGNQPTVAALRGELKAKYGTFDHQGIVSRGPQGERVETPNENIGVIVHSADQQRLTRNNSLYSSCLQHPSLDRFDEGGIERCGLRINYVITPSETNPNLAFKLQLNVVNHREVARQIDAALDVASAKHLAEQERVAKENEAEALNATNGVKPQL